MASEFLYGVRIKRTASAGLDPLTPWLLIAYVLLLIGGAIYAHVRMPELIEQGRIDKAVTPGLLWTFTVAFLVCFFTVIGPMVLLGVFISSKLMKYPLSGAAYLKACGVVATPALVLGLARLLPPNLVLILIALVAVLPVTFYVLKSVFELSLTEGAVTFVISAVTGFIGMFIAGLILTVVTLTAATTTAVAARQGGAGPSAPGPSAPAVTPPRVATPDSGRPAPPQPTKSPLESFRQTLADRAGQTPDTSRESQQRELTTLKSQANALGAATDAEVARLLKELDARAAAAPSERPEPSLFDPPVASAAWNPADAQAALLGEEVSFRSFNVRIPRGYKASLGSSESDSKGVTFTGGGADGGSITLRVVPATEPKQRRPWVIARTFQKSAAQRERLFALDAVGGTSDAGTIAGLAFTRVRHDAGKRWGVSGPSAQYAARTNDGWLVIEAVAPSSGPATLDLLEASAQSLRPRPEGDPKLDPLSTDALAARLSEDPDRVGQLLRLRGKAAEPAVLAQLKSGDPRVARAAATVLADLGTEKSLPALQEAVRSSDRLLADAAREALKKLQPKEMDAIAEALLDIETGDNFRKRAAMERLAALTPPPAGDARREKVAAVLEAELLGKDSFFVAEQAGGALAAWSGKQTVTRLLPLLADEHCSPHQCKAAIAALSPLKDKRTVYPIVRWIIKEPEAVTDALTQMGPVAEPEVIKLLMAREASARTAAARILQEIGTVKSLTALKRAAQDTRDPGASAAAQVALDLVTERWKASKAATTAPVD